MSTANHYEYRAACRDEWQDAMGLAWRAFLKFVAPDYSEEGIRSFRNFVTDSMLHRMFIIGDYPLFGAYDQDRMIGMITLRGKEHISLLFVDEHYQHQGVGSVLVGRAGHYIRTQFGKSRMTVNAAPGAAGFYHRVGFSDTDAERLADGIRYIPMQLYLTEKAEGKYGVY